MKSKEDVNILFKQGNTDERILKSMAEDAEHKYDSEELSKALDKAKLVQKEVQVRGKNGQMHTRKQWVKAGENPKSDRQPKAQENPKTKTKTRKVTNVDDMMSGIKKVNRTIASELNAHNSVSVLNGQSGLGETKALVSVPKLGGDAGKAKKIIQEQFSKEFGDGVNITISNGGSGHPDSLIVSLKMKDGSGSNSNTQDTQDTQDKGSTTKGNEQKEKKEHWTKAGTSQEAKAQIAQMLASGKSREDCMSDFKAQGVTWKEHENPAINWMRAAMAMNKHLTSGAVNPQENEPNSKSEETASDSKKSSETNSQKKFENGHVDKNGDLVADDKSELSDLVSEITGTDPFDQKDYATEALEKNPDYKGAYIESMGIDKASQNKDGSISVTAYVEGYVEDDRDGSSENFDTYVTFDIPAKGSDNNSKETTENTKENSNYKNGNIDKNGNLVANDKSELSDLVSEITDTDMFDQKDYALSEVEKEYPDATIESIGIEKASQNKDGSVHVTAHVEGYTDDDSFETTVSFDIPNKNKKSVIGSDYTQLTTEKESGTIEGEAHNMMVGWLQSENGGKKKPTKSQIKKAATSLKESALKTVISSYNQDTLVHQLAMAKHFTKLAGGNMDHMTLENIYKDVASGQGSYTQEQKCDALAKLCGKDYDSSGDYVRKYASNSLANASITPMSKGNFEVTFSYDDGASRKERFDSVKSAKEAADKFIAKEEKYTSEKKSK